MGQASIHHLMTYSEAISVLCVGIQEYLIELENQRDSGPEGIEVYAQSLIDRLTHALNIVEGRHSG